MTIPGILDLLHRVRWSSFHLWSSLHNLLLPLGGSLAEVSRRWVKRRNARLARHWPVADGQVQFIDVKSGTRFFGSARSFSATFKYSYRVQDGSELSYYSGDFSRTFPAKERAWEWLEMLKNQRIRVHYQPGHPEISSVLAADLDAHFSLPARTPADFVRSLSATHPE